MLGAGNPVVRNVTRPTLTPVLPESRKATGAGVIVAPGGGFFMLSMESEGFAIARQLADQGVAAFVLKYRLDPTPPAEAQFLPFMMQRLSRPRDPNAPRSEAHVDANADALAALRVVRDRAATWHVDPKRVGMIGFSAGAITALSIAQAPTLAERPSFIGYVYGPQSIDTAPDDAPPLFDALAIDDPIFHATNFPIVAAWATRKRPVELHVYGSGGHGFGAGRPGQTHSMLTTEFVAWLRMLGFLTPPAGK
jgi:acetyl esterase/lipase